MTVLGRLYATRALSLFVLLLLATPVAVAWTARQAYVRTELPDVGIDVDANLGVEAFDGRWDIQQRDRVVALDGVPVKDPADWVERALEHPGELAVTFERDGRQFTLTAMPRPLHWSDRLAVWARVVTAALLMLMGLVVFVARPGASVTWVLLALAWDLGFFLLLKIGLWFDPRLYKICSIYPWALLVATGVHFLGFFPQRIEWLRKTWRVLLLYLPVPAGAVIHLSGWVTSASRAGTLYGTLAAVVIVVVVAAQYRKIRRTNEARARSQYRALLVGFTIGLVLPALWNWLRIRFNVWNSPWAAHYNALPLVLFIGVTSHAVVRHNALAIDRFTAAVVGYGATTVLLGGMFAAALVGVPLVLGSSIGDSPALLVLTTGLTFAGFSPAYRVIKRWIDRRFFREQADASQVADALRDLVLKMQQASRDDAIIAAFDAAAILRGDRVELWLLAPEQKELRLDRRQGASQTSDAPVPLAGPLGKALGSGTSAGMQELAPRALDSAAQEELWAHELAMAAPIMVHGVLAGFVAVGRKRSGAGYTIEELSFLTICAAQLAAALERTEGESRLDRYHLERRLGTGGMAEVFLAWQVGPGGFERKVALKRPLPHVSEDPNAVASFLDEARLAAQLVHPHIAQVYDVGERSGSYFIVMEYVDGPSLRQILRGMEQKKRVMPVAVAVAIARDVLSALDYAHRVRDASGRELRLVHRDVSPRNILINRHGEPKLVDFGIARAQFQLHVTRTGVVKGTLPYMSPEQASDHQLDHRSDLYSAACVLYEMLTAEMPFPKGPGTRKPKPAYAIAPDVPAALDRVLRRATETSPEARFGSAGELVSAMLEAIAPARPAEPADVIAFLRVVCPAQMGDGADHAASLGEPEPEPNTGERTVAEGKQQTVAMSKRKAD